MLLLIHFCGMGLVAFEEVFAFRWNQQPLWPPVNYEYNLKKYLVFEDGIDCHASDMDPWRQLKNKGENCHKTERWLTLTDAGCLVDLREALLQEGKRILSTESLSVKTKLLTRQKSFCMFRPVNQTYEQDRCTLGRVLHIFDSTFDPCTVSSSLSWSEVNIRIKVWI